jgi:hypothetical protein
LIAANNICRFATSIQLAQKQQNAAETICVVIRTTTATLRFALPQDGSPLLECGLPKGEATIAHRHQRGWLKKETRRQGETWVLFFRTVRKSDRKRVENKIPIGLVRDFPDKNRAWEEVERQHLHINQADFRGCVTFADLAHHYAEHELIEPTESIHLKAHTTIRGYERVLRNRLLPRWRKRVALSIEPLEVEQWLKGLKDVEGLEG